jgi:hypothetical protein
MGLIADEGGHLPLADNNWPIDKSSASLAGYDQFPNSKQFYGKQITDQLAVIGSRRALFATA